MKNETDTLNETIDWLHDKQAQDLKSLSEQFYQTYESLKPINLINSTLQEASASPEMKHDLLKNAMGLAIGFLSKRAILMASKNLLRNNTSILLQITVAMVVLRNTNTIVKVLDGFIQGFFKNSSKKNDQ